MMILRTIKRQSEMKIIIIVIAVLSMLMFLGTILAIIFMAAGGGNQIEVIQKNNVSPEALEDAAKLYTKTNIYWLDILAAYAAENGPDWEEYSYSKLKDAAENVETIKKEDQDNFDFYKEIYETIYENLVDTYKETSDDGDKKTIYFYYNSFFPIAKGRSTSYSDDFMDPRDFEDVTFHDGNDLVADEGTPIISVEGGEIETIGWNAAGGWRIGIRSGKRFWYYAHMRKVHPYYMKLRKGDHVEEGEVIGYVGSTGYSSNIPNNVLPDEDTETYEGVVDTNMIKHLHIGLQVKLKLSSEGEEIDEWVNPYPILKFLENNKISVKKETVTEIEEKKVSGGNTIPGRTVPGRDSGKTRTKEVEVEVETGEYVTVEEDKDPEEKVFGKYRIREED